MRTGAVAGACLNIPARYYTGYASDIGVPPPHPPQDFAAWIEVFLSGAWHAFDPRNLSPRKGRILIARAATPPTCR
jgi:transglutaminase-like putative cysteine protease